MGTGLPLLQIQFQAPNVILNRSDAESFFGLWISSMEVLVIFGRRKVFKKVIFSLMAWPLPPLPT